MQYLIMGTIRKELAEAVIKECFNDSLKNALKKHKVNAQNFFKTLAEVPSLDEEYSRAQQSRSELFMDEIIDIADNEDIDYNRARNMIQVRQLYASKMKPNKFGDRIDVNINQHVSIRDALDEAKNRVREVLDITKTLTLEQHTEKQNTPTGSKPVDEIGGTAKNDIDDLLS